MKPTFLPKGKVLLLALLVVGVLFISGGANVRAQETSSWQLLNHPQNRCFSPYIYGLYYGTWIKGSWSHSIDIGITQLPPGGTYQTYDAPIPPGSSDGLNPPAHLLVRLPNDTFPGLYTMTLWASDGITRQTESVTVDVKRKCNY